MHPDRTHLRNPERHMYNLPATCGCNLLHAVQLLVVLDSCCVAVVGVAGTSPRLQIVG